MRKPDLSAATEVAAVATVATAQKEVQPAVTDSQRMVSSHVLKVNSFLFRAIRIFHVSRGFDHLLVNCFPLSSLIAFVCL